MTHEELYDVYISYDEKSSSFTTYEIIDSLFLKTI